MLNLYQTLEIMKTVTIILITLLINFNTGKTTKSTTQGCITITQSEIELTSKIPHSFSKSTTANLNTYTWDIDEEM